MQACDADEELLLAHANDDEVVGYARKDTQCEFARRAYPALLLACEQRGALVSVIEMYLEHEAKQRNLAQEAEIVEAVQRELIREREREIKALKTEVRRERMRATVGGGSVL